MTRRLAPWERAMVRVVARLVPAGERSVWIEEWTGELLAARREPGGGATRLLAGALGDALMARRIARERKRGGARVGIMNGVWADARHGARSLRGAPVFTLVAVLTLGLGAGAATTMFGAVRAVLLRPLPYADADRVVVVRQTDVRDGSVREGASAANARDVGEASRTLEHVAVAGAYGFTLMEGGRAHSVRGWTVSAGFFEALGVRARLGRTFRAEEYGAGAERVVVLGHGAWQTRFAGDPGVLGRELDLDGVAHTVVGVLPAAFAYPSAAELWAPRPPQPWDEDTRAGSGLFAVARLAPGATLAQARTELDDIAAGLARVHPATNANVGLVALPLRDALLGSARTPLLLLLAAGVLVLLIAAINVAGLQLARGALRARELVVRRALGADTVRIVRLLSLESLWIALAGGAVGIGLAALGTRLLRTLGPLSVPRLADARIDGAALGFALLACAASVLMAGLAPGLGAARAGVRDGLADGARGTTGSRRAVRMREHLVVGEIALALVLAIAAGLLLRSFAQVMRVEPGFSAADRLAVQVFAYDEDDRPDVAYIRRAREAIAALPGVHAVGLTTAVPLADNATLWSMHGLVRFSIDGAGDAPGAGPVARLVAVDSGYAAVLDVPVTAGRGFDGRDAPGSLPVALVNEAFVRRYLADADPIGRMIRAADGVPHRIVGVLGDVRATSLEAAPPPEIYLPYFQSPRTGGVTFVMRTSPASPASAAAVQEALWSVDAGKPVWAAQSLPSLVRDRTRARRFSTALFGTFAALALLLAGTGVYGLMSFAVAQRTGELGVRRALGAGTSDILHTVLERGLRLALMGAALGLLGAAAVSRLLRTMLFDVRPLDPVTFGVTTVAVAGVALLAAWRPARRAARVDPLAALRGVES